MAKEPRVIPFAEIEQMFAISGMYRRSNDTETVVQVKPYPQVFVIDSATGEVVAAPRGFAKVFRPGRIDLTDMGYAFNRHADQPWYFTFGGGQTLPDGTAAQKRYVVIVGTCDGTRAAMTARFGSGWSMQYLTAERAGVDRFGLTQYLETIVVPRGDHGRPGGYELKADDVAPNAGSAS